MSRSSSEGRGRAPSGNADESSLTRASGGNGSQPHNGLVRSPSEALLLPHDDDLARDWDGQPFVGMAVGEQLDAFRELRTRLLAMGASIGLNRFTVLAVPITGRSGASFVSRNLAAAFTLQEQRRAVLIDCNLRSPVQHVVFEILDEIDGLFDYLESPHSRPERLLCRTEVPGLYLIPAGRPSSSAHEYFSSTAMRSLLAWLRRTPCFLVLDGPPAMGSPDARILSDLADFVILIAGHGRDTAEGITQAASLFDPAKLAGVVFNKQT